MPVALDIIDQTILDAFRARWQAVTKATTGARTDISVDATTGDYVRLAGSFLDDGFDLGDEATAAGFVTSANNGLSVVTHVTALRLRVWRPWDTTWALVTEAAGPSVTIATTLPVTQKLDGWSVKPLTGRPWLREHFQPLGRVPATLGSTASPARVRTSGLYWVTVFYPAGTGSAGAQRLRGKINAAIVAGGQLNYNGQVIRVQESDPKGKEEEPSWTGYPMCFPFTADTFNPA